MSERPLTVHKVGGGALRAPEDFGQVAEVLRQSPGANVIVVSALHGVTDELLRAARRAADGGRPAALEALRFLQDRHADWARRLLQPPALTQFLRFYDRLHRNAQSILSSMARLRETPPAAMDRLLSLGELSSSYMLTLFLRQQGFASAWADARRLIQTNNQHGHAQPLFPETRLRTREVLTALLREDIVPVVPGFIGRSVAGRTTTLGRGGSDLTATLIAVVLKATRVILWTDVAAIMSADPRLVPTAFTIPAVPYEEAVLLAKLGVKRFHPEMLEFVYRRGIPVVIRSLRDLQAPGTTIHMDARLPDGPHVIAHLPHVTLVRLEFALPLRRPLIRVLRALYREFRPLAVMAQQWPPTITLLIAGTQVPESLREKPSRFGATRVHVTTAGLIMIVGQNLRSYLSTDDVVPPPARVLHEWATDVAIPVLVPTERLADLVRTIHDRCFAGSMQDAPRQVGGPGTKS
ncbi:Lysine-sensitive aspartokinase 3 [bacterium HR11]|nr:Lysine-sensitive aspartokinase 3 [bacterium HR11]